VEIENVQHPAATPTIGRGDEGQYQWVVQAPDYLMLIANPPHQADNAFSRSAVALLCEQHLLQVLSTRRHYLVQKRLIDIVISAFGLAVLAVPMLLIAVAIAATSRDWPVFRQVRHGKESRPITVFKFVTMHPTNSDREGLKQAVANDPRVTSLGRLLRKTSIDELPQLWNVLKGDMSLVGPRAHPIGMHGGGVPYEELCPLYPLRHLVKPGITGFAQVSGFRGETRDPQAARMRVAYDLSYIGAISFANDVRILLKTLFVELPRLAGL
jgi:lipopolysaccharide/colanic/teichoic acid biosynthesis glycosyltransferase